MKNDTECNCPPKPYFTLGSFASGSNYEAMERSRWEEQHGTHPAAALARLEPVWLDSAQRGVYLTRLHEHLEKKGPTTPIEVSPHVLKSLIDYAGLANSTPERVQRELDKALEALRRVDITGAALPQEVAQSVAEARDRLREAGAK